MTSATPMWGWMAPVVPTRRKVRTPNWASSSTAMDTDGPPIPVEQITMGTPLMKPSQLVNSRLLARNSGLSVWDAMDSERAGSPGTIASVAPLSIFLVKPK